jgi:glycosyltransferase involved in cell wall biosynthesis
MARATPQACDLLFVPLGAQAFGGAERSLLDLATRFAAAGARIAILIGPELQATEFVAEARSRGLELYPVDWSPRKGLMANIRALTVFGRLQTRIIHFNISWLRGMWLVPLAARVLTHAKLLGSMRAMPDPHHLIPRRRYFGFVPGLQLWHLPELAVGWLWGRILHRTITVNANDFRERLVGHYGYPRDRIGVIYNGVDTEVRVSEQERAGCRESLGIDDKTFLLCAAGRVSVEKGLHHLIDAISGLPPIVHLVIVGDGPQRQDLKRQASSLQLKDRVHFVGHTSTPERWMAACDIVVVPSTWYEAFGRVVVEAMVQGTPVVASRIGGMAELFEDGVHGRYVTPGSAEDLRKVLAELIAEPHLLQSMGSRAISLVNDRYSLSRVTADYLCEYERLAGAGHFGTAPSAATPSS